MYMPTLGRWISKDRLPEKGEPEVLYTHEYVAKRMRAITDPYGYAINNPISYFDPSGLVAKCTIELWCWPAFWGIAGANTVHCQFLIAKSAGGTGQCRGHGRFCVGPIDTFICDCQCLTSTWMPNTLPNKKGKYRAASITTDEKKCSCLRNKCQNFPDENCYVAVLIPKKEGYGTSNTAAYCLNKSCGLGFDADATKVAGKGKDPHGWGFDGGCPKNL